MIVVIYSIFNHHVCVIFISIRLASEAQKQIKLSEKFEDVSLGNNRPTALIQQYGALYSQTRLDALDSLDSLPQLAELENLKNKLLFSVIVVSKNNSL